MATTTPAHHSATERCRRPRSRACACCAIASVSTPPVSSVPTAACSARCRPAAPAWRHRTRSPGHPTPARWQSTSSCAAAAAPVAHRPPPAPCLSGKFLSQSLACPTFHAALHEQGGEEGEQIENREAEELPGDAVRLLPFRRAVDCERPRQEDG